MARIETWKEKERKRKAREARLALQSSASDDASATTSTASSSHFSLTPSQVGAPRRKKSRVSEKKVRKIGNKLKFVYVHMRGSNSHAGA